MGLLNDNKIFNELNGLNFRCAQLWLSIFIQVIKETASQNMRGTGLC